MEIDFGIVVIDSVSQGRTICLKNITNKPRIFTLKHVSTLSKSDLSYMPNLGFILRDVRSAQVVEQNIRIYILFIL